MELDANVARLVEKLGAAFAIDARVPTGIAM